MKMNITEEPRQGYCVLNYTYDTLDYVIDESTPNR